MAVSGRRKKESKEGRLGIIGIVALVVVFAVVIYSKTIESKGELEELNKKQEQLQESLYEEEARSEALEEKKIYVKTKLYVEEMAKKLGLVYPDEIIYRPKED